MEGLTPEDCSFYRAMERAANEPQPASTHRRKKAGGAQITFGAGDYLTEQSSRAVTLKSIARVVLLAGEPGSGKTTLFASVNDAFQKGPFAQYVFAGSLTLPGFERICYQARIASGRMMPSTERTKVTEDIRFLHLRVRDIDLSQPGRDLLLADVSGERLELLRNSSEEASKMTIVERADHVVILFDGGKLASPETRQSAKVKGTTLLRSMLDAGLIGSNSFIDVVFSKWDLVETGADSAACKSFTRQIRADIQEKFGPRLGRLRFFEMAARPDTESKLEFAYGIPQMLTSWLEESPFLAKRDAVFPPLSLATREFSRYASRRPPKKTP